MKRGENHHASYFACLWHRSIHRLYGRQYAQGRQGPESGCHHSRCQQISGPEYADKIDLLLLGPHFSAEVPKYRDMLKDHHVKVASIDPDNYASLDGEAILEEAIDFYNEE